MAGVSVPRARFYGDTFFRHYFLIIVSQSRSRLTGNHHTQGKTEVPDSVTFPAQCTYKPGRLINKKKRTFCISTPSRQLRKATCVGTESKYHNERTA